MPKYRSPTAEAEHRIEEAKKSRATELNLSSLGLTVVPESVRTLTRLRRLIISENQVTTVPDSLRTLSRLTEFDARGNLLATVPGFLYFTERLYRLRLDNNSIGEIPEFLGRLSNLRYLGLSHNEIAVIPHTLGELKNLETLDLEFNRITSISSLIIGLPHLRALRIEKNPGLGIPDEILASHDRRQILTYYLAQSSASKPLNEAKLLLVGRGGVGKTSLIRTLTTGRFDPHEKTTEGIKISDWTCGITAKDNVSVHIWDFGGQEMLHATHQFFLTARSLYLLVLNRRQDDCNEEFEYWHRLIRAFGGQDAPVVIVLNKQGSEPFDVNRAGWTEKYPDNIKAFVETDCADPASMALLAVSIRDRLAQMESLKAKFPTRWFAIKDRLANMKDDYVTFDRYRAICTELGESDAELQTSLSGYLHDLGIALNYRDDPRLRFACVLKPEWVTEGIYALLHAFVSSKGLFTPAEAEKALGAKGYDYEATHFILSLMERFEISFPLRDSKKRILIPQLLDDQQPPQASEFQPAGCLNFGYRYPVITAGLLPRFIVRTQHLSEPVGRWKSGVILRDAAGCRALVRTDPAERQVRIHIDGPEDKRREMLAIVRHNFDVIHSDYEFIPEDLVYPPGAPGKPLVLDELETMQREGVSVFPVVLENKSVIKPKIGDLLKPVDTPKVTLRLFLSYAHEDEVHVDVLRKNLRRMERDAVIRTFHDRQLTPGEKWESRILQELNEADVIVLQISPDFLASDFCMESELPRAVERKLRGEAELIACILRPCEWNQVDALAQFQVLPKDALPLSKWKDPDDYWLAITEGIRKTLEKFKTARHRAASTS